MEFIGTRQQVGSGGLRYKGIIFGIIPTPTVLGARLGGTLGDIDLLSKGPIKRARKGPFKGWIYRYLYPWAPFSI